MSTEEINLVKEIFDLKKIKSEHIQNKNYEQAAITRDLERDLERKLVGDFNHDIHQKMEEYFKSNFGIVYPKNILTQTERDHYDNFVKGLLRQEKLKDLGI